MQISIQNIVRRLWFKNLLLKRIIFITVCEHLITLDNIELLVRSIYIFFIILRYKFKFILKPFPERSLRLSTPSHAVTTLSSVVVEYANDKWHRRLENKLPDLSDTAASWQCSAVIHLNPQLWCEWHRKTLILITSYAHKLPHSFVSVLQYLIKCLCCCLQECTVLFLTWWTI